MGVDNCQLQVYEYIILYEEPLVCEYFLVCKLFFLISTTHLQHKSFSFNSLATKNC
jgi:heme/copper-type cytochrome/quinol oxidase subunit 3